jgi:hypothetical protein
MYCRHFILSLSLLTCIGETVWLTEGWKYAPRGPHFYSPLYRPTNDKEILQIVQVIDLTTTIHSAWERQTDKGWKLFGSGRNMTKYLNNNNNNNNWSHWNSNEKLNEKSASYTRKTFDRFTTADSYTWNITHNTESTAVWNLKPERWGSPLAQQKYQEESMWQETTIIIIIIISNITGYNEPRLPIDHGSPTRDPPGCIMWPTTTFVNREYTKHFNIILAIGYTTYCYWSTEPTFLWPRVIEMLETLAISPFQRLFFSWRPSASYGLKVPIIFHHPPPTHPPEFTFPLSAGITQSV